LGSCENLHLFPESSAVSTVGLEQLTFFTMSILEIYTEHLLN